MSLGDLIELIGLACIVTCAAILLGTGAAFGAAGVAAILFAHGFGNTPLPHPHLSRLHLPRRKKAATDDSAGLPNEFMKGVY